MIIYRGSKCVSENEWIVLETYRRIFGCYRICGNGIISNVFFYRGEGLV